jgi:hypothetical protein
VIPAATIFRTKPPARSTPLSFVLCHGLAVVSHCTARQDAKGTFLDLQANPGPRSGRIRRGMIRKFGQGVSGFKAARRLEPHWTSLSVIMERPLGRRTRVERCAAQYRVVRRHQLHDGEDGFQITLRRLLSSSNPEVGHVRGETD